MNEMTLERAVELLNERDNETRWEANLSGGVTAYRKGSGIFWAELTAEDAIAIASYPELRAENKALRAALKQIIERPLAGAVVNFCEEEYQCDFCLVYRIDEDKEHLPDCPIRRARALIGLETGGTS